MKRLVALCALLAAPPLLGQPAEIKPVTLGQAMPEIALPSIQGSDVVLSALRGKNVVLVFPRVFYATNAWCTICNYQYAELVALELREKIRQKYNAEFLFVIPFGKEVTEKWLGILPEQLEKIATTKHPKDPQALDEAARARAVRFAALFPKDFSAKDLEVKPGEMARPFPVLMDADRKLSLGLGLFTTEWGGGKGEQNIPAIYVLDRKGVVSFKYISQNTADRPSAAYLLKVLEVVNAMP